MANKEIITIKRTATIREAAHSMRELHVGNVIVVEDQTGGKTKPIGILTDRDIVMEVIAQDLDPEDVSVEDIMARELCLVNERDPLEVVIKKMKRFSVGRLPVVDKDNNLCGIISRHDLLKITLKLLNSLSAITWKQMDKESKLRL